MLLATIEKEKYSTNLPFFPDTYDMTITSARARAHASDFEFLLFHSVPSN